MKLTEWHPHFANQKLEELGLFHLFLIAPNVVHFEKLLHQRYRSSFFRNCLQSIDRCMFWFLSWLALLEIIMSAFLLEQLTYHIATSVFHQEVHFFFWTLNPIQDENSPVLSNLSWKNSSSMESQILENEGIRKFSSNVLNICAMIVILQSNEWYQEWFICNTEIEVSSLTKQRRHAFKSFWTCKVLRMSPAISNELWEVLDSLSQTTQCLQSLWIWCRKYLIDHFESLI